jgi:spore germination protein YaaH
MARPRGRAERRWPRHLLRVGLVALFGFVVIRVTSSESPPKQPSVAGDVAAATRAATARPEPGREVYGYVPYWEMDDGIAAHVATTDLTTLALFSVTQRRDGSLATDETGYRRIVGDVGRRLIAEARERGTRVELVWASFGSDKNRAFFADAAAQDRLVAELPSFAAQQGFDGINVDVEGLPAEYVPAYGTFVARLRDAVRASDADARVTVATGAGRLGAAMAAIAAGNGADRIFLMGYDYRTAGSEPGATAPLHRADGDEKDLIWSLDGYRALGVPVERTILGLPLYGMTWPAADTGMGAPATGRGDAWILARHAGQLLDAGLKPTLDKVESVEFFARAQGRGAVAVYYDSPRTLVPKLALAEQRSLAGAGFWAIGYERGLPTYTELIEAFRSGR